MIELSGVEKICAYRDRGHVDDRVELFAAADRDGVRRVVQIISGQVSQQASMKANHLQRYAESGQRVVFRHAQIRDPQQRSGLTGGLVDLNQSRLGLGNALYSIGVERR